MTALLFDPTRLPERTEEGWLAHPDLDAMLEAHENEEDEAPVAIGKLADAGLSAVYVLMADQIDDSDPGYEGYFKRGEASCSFWTPKPPFEDARLAAIYDTEDGPAAMYVLPIKTGEAIG